MSSSKGQVKLCPLFSVQVSNFQKFLFFLTSYHRKEQRIFSCCIGKCFKFFDKMVKKGTFWKLSTCNVGIWTTEICSRGLFIFDFQHFVFDVVLFWANACFKSNFPTIFFTFICHTVIFFAFIVLVNLQSSMLLKFSVLFFLQKREKISSGRCSTTH